MNHEPKRPKEQILPVNEAVLLMAEHTETIRGASERFDIICRETSRALADSGESPIALTRDIHKQAMSAAPSTDKPAEDPVHSDNKVLHTTRVEAAADACQILLDRAVAIEDIIKQVLSGERSKCNVIAGDASEAKYNMSALNNLDKKMSQQERFATLREEFNRNARWLLRSYDALVEKTAAETQEDSRGGAEKLTIDNLSQRFDDAIRQGFALEDWSQVVAMWRTLIGEVSDLFGMSRIGRPENPQQMAILNALQGLGDRFDRVAGEERAAGRKTRANSISVQGLAMQLFAERVPGYSVGLGPRR